MTLTDAEELKFGVLGEGIAITARARDHIVALNHERQLTSADYASTSGVILALEDDVWVNAPVAEHNPNFVDEPRFTLDHDDSTLVLSGAGHRSVARFWLQPTWHERVASAGERFVSFGFTHGDRLRLSPVEGCAFTCKFCDLPYEFRYRTKRIEGLVETLTAARRDPIQPAAHVLVSGGTPRHFDIGYLHECYERIVLAAAPLPVDVMMVPTADYVDLERLAAIGVTGLCLNIEINDRDLAGTLMRRKHDHGLDAYLNFIGRAVDIFGGSRVRSMLVAGLETTESTLAGVEAIARLGAMPVLSPFRPDPSTPLRDHAAPTSAFLRDVYLRARDITIDHGVALGATCQPCAHNTLTLASTTGNGDADHAHGAPALS